MSKGFGFSSNGDLGYVLLLLPDLKAYAANFKLEGEDEKFIGITNDLESAQVWKTIKGARKGLRLYLNLLMDELESKDEIEVIIKKLKRLNNGKLKDEYCGETTTIQKVPPK